MPIIADGFYEFTTPDQQEGSPKKKLKDKWLFKMRRQRWFCIAGIYRAHAEVGELFTMLTTEPGPDVAPHHDRQIVALSTQDWSRWLDPNVPAGDVLRALPAGSLDHMQVG